MGNDGNRFGGMGRYGLYTPMSEDEQEVIARLVAARDLDVHLVGWGVIRNIEATFGDLRVKVPIQITFNRPEVPVAVPYFDLELRTGAGVLLYGERQSTEYGGQPLVVGIGTQISMIWDIAIRSMDPKLVKALKPGARGLTSRWLDKDTGEFTFLGNTKMCVEDQLALKRLREGEQYVRNLNRLRAEKSSGKG
jgi:hypothetical protein